MGWLAGRVLNFLFSDDLKKRPATPTKRKTHGHRRRPTNHDQRRRQKHNMPDHTLFEGLADIRGYQRNADDLKRAASLVGRSWLLVLVADLWLLAASGCVRTYAPLISKHSLARRVSPVALTAT